MQVTLGLTANRLLIRRIGSLAFHSRVVILGPVGVGKTVLSNALGHLFRRAGFSVRLSSADALLRLDFSASNGSVQRMR